MSDFSLYELSSVHDPRLESWLDLYESAFPPEERGRVSWILQNLLAREAGRQNPDRVCPHRMWALLDGDGDFTGMAYTSLNAQLRLVYLGYFAVRAERRGQGHGTTFYRMLLPAVWEGAGLMVFDVERPDLLEDGVKRQAAERRIGFYERLGACVLPGMTLWWGAARQRMMVQRFTPLAEKEVFGRARAQVLGFGGNYGRTRGRRAARILNRNSSRHTDETFGNGRTEKMLVVINNRRQVMRKILLIRHWIGLS